MRLDFKFGENTSFSISCIRTVMEEKRVIFTPAVMTVSFCCDGVIYYNFFRAKIERDYGEKLMNLAKTASGKDEIG